MSTEAIETLQMVAAFLALGVAPWGMGYGAAKLLRLFEVSSSIAER
jgi:hypothetical protein